MEIRIPITAAQVEYRCDVCKLGVMRPCGQIITTAPVRYPHRCTDCGHEAVFTTRYPRIDYAYVDPARSST